MTAASRQQFVIGIDVGGTKIAAAIADTKGQIISRNITPTQAKKGSIAVCNKINLCINHLLEDTGIKLNRVKNITLGIPGQIDKKSGLILNAPNIKGWENFDLVQELRKTLTDTPIILENDANCATMAENVFGAGKSYKNMIFLTISTGIGGGIVLDGKLYNGEHNIAGEIGHMILNLSTDPEVKCSCGRFGGFEAYASGTSMAKRARRKLKDMQILKNEYGTKVLELSERNFNKITSVILGQAAKMGDQFAIDTIKENATYIGHGCANIINILDPEAIVIGGGVSKIGKLLFDTIKKTCKAHVKMTRSLKTQIIPAETGTDAGLLGCIALGLQQ